MCMLDPAVDPAVTAAAVRSTVAGAHTAAGFVMTTVGSALIVTTDRLYVGTSASCGSLDIICSACCYCVRCGKYYRACGIGKVCVC